MNRLLQALGLDLKKGFQLLETHADSHLKQQREALHLLQSDNKAMSGELATLVASSDEAKASDKQLSVDLHVCKETLRQKIETPFTASTSALKVPPTPTFVASTHWSPSLKHLGDQCKDMLDYLVRGNQHDMAQQESMRTTMESTGNAEDRIVRVESLCGGLIDQINEVSDLIQQVREAQQLQQEQLATIVERTPKLPNAPPPRCASSDDDTAGFVHPGYAGSYVSSCVLEPNPPTLRLSDQPPSLWYETMVVLSSWWGMP